jgi:predicted AlkP superfamily phosphohydrolase/phosphomutase
MSNRVFLIGIDGADWSLLDPFIEKGKLPNFQKIKQNSLYTDLESLLPPLSPLAWTTIFTGVGPEKHKIFSFVTKRKESYLIRPISTKDRKSTTIWQYLSESGKEVLLINIPFSYPPDKVRGVMVSGLGSPSVKSNFVYPPDLKNTIIKKFPDYDVDYSEDLLMRGIAQDKFLEIVRKKTDAQIEFFKYMLQSSKAQLIVFIIRSLDVILHYFWKRDDVVFSFCKQIDDYLGWLLNRFNENKDALIICSDHGFCYSHRRFYINNWLEQLGLFRIRTKEVSVQKISSRLSEYIVRKLIENNLKSLVWNLKRLSWSVPLIKFIKPPSVKTLCKTIWTDTKAYYQEGSEGIVNINLKNREPEGCVDIAEYEELREKIIQEAIKLVDPDNNKNVFLLAKRGEEVYNCPRQNDIPDIVLLKNEGYTLKGYNNKQNLFENISHRNGEHHPLGIVSFLGSVFKKGRLDKNISIKYITPVILELFQVTANLGEIPSHVLNNIIRRRFGKTPKDNSFSKRNDKPLSKHIEAEGVYSQKQEEIIKKRLEGLGYI